MVRSKTGIENYVNMIGISMVIVMPFKNKELSKYEFKSPQEIKNSFGDRIKEELELILSNLLKTLKLNKNNIEIKDIIEYLTWVDSAS